MKIRANFFIKIWVNITKRKSAKMPAHLQKSTTPHFNGHCTKPDDISVIVTCFFFSQVSLAFKSNPVFIDILDSFCHSLFTFLPFDYWYSTNLKFIASAPFYKKQYSIDEVQWSFFKVFNLKMLLLCHIFYETFLTVNGNINS